MKQRVMTAAVLVAIVLVLFLIPSNFARIVMALVSAIASTLAYKEIIDLRESKKNPYPFMMKVIGFVSMILIVFNSLSTSSLYTGISSLSVCLVILILIIPSIFDKKGKYTTKDAFYLIGTTIMIGLFFNILMLLFFVNKWLLLYLLLIGTMTDTFAMLIGCLIGKHKLIPDVSPKKSVEGSIAGSLVATIIASIYYYNVVTSGINLIVLIVMTLILSVLGQLGDLFFSKIKRENEIKDFSNLMPGHGGILDRFDSMTFIVFGYIIIMNIMNIIK